MVLAVCTRQRVPQRASHNFLSFAEDDIEMCGDLTGPAYDAESCQVTPLQGRTMTCRSGLILRPIL
jgi:hypothetical protein